MDEMTYGAKRLMKRLEMGPLPLGHLYVCGDPWSPADVEWLRSRGMIRVDGLLLVRVVEE